MKPILDATAGNRLMWRRKEGVPHDPPHVIFMDKETGLSIKQDVIGDFRGLVSSVCVDDSYFRDAVFWSVRQLGCEAPLGELDACVECSRKVVGDYSDPHLWCVFVSGVLYCVARERVSGSWDEVL